MKGENQIIVRCKEPIKIEKHYNGCCRFLTMFVKEIFFRLFRCHFFSFYFLSALQSDNDSNKVYVLGHKSVYDTKYFTSLSERAFKVIKNGIYFIVMAFFVAELFKVLVYAN